jgi:hypothetical protein
LTTFTHWLLRENKSSQPHHTHPWWQVMCLTGVDYFSTLGYQPGIAALAAGSLAPIATLILVLLTLFGALPVYRRVARISPHGEGSISMLEHLLPWWQGKFLVLCLLGFVATDFIITITLSAADAAAHVIENPFFPAFLKDEAIPITLIFILFLGFIFLKGFQEAIGLAVVLVAVYLVLNAVTIAVAMQKIVIHPSLITDWQQHLWSTYHNPVQMLLVAALLFPKLALGLSGFETGVAVMPLVEGNAPTTHPIHPEHAPEPEREPDNRHDPNWGRITNTRKLLTTAAAIMSVFLIASSFVTTLLIPAAAFQAGGTANGRALAYLAHLYLGETFGTLYDLSTMAILWFAGASAMAGLLNIVPRYLPRYGMAPNWAKVTRPLVLIYTAIAFVVTVIFKANVEAQGGAYATGVLVLMTSAAFAVMLATLKRRFNHNSAIFLLITVIFLYTTVANVIERPDGVKIAGFFIAAIILTSLGSRVWRSTEIRAEHITLDAMAQQFIVAAVGKTPRLIAHRRRAGDAPEYAFKEQEMRQDHYIPASDPVLFIEVEISDASEFAESIVVEGIQVDNYQILRTRSAAVPNAIAAILLYIREQTGTIPHAYFGWAEGNPVQYLLRFLLFGEGDTAVVTREVLRRAEQNPKQRPSIHVGG